MPRGKKKKKEGKGSDPPWSKLGRYPILHQLEESQALPQIFKGKAKLPETPGFRGLALLFSARWGFFFFTSLGVVVTYDTHISK